VTDVSEYDAERIYEVPDPLGEPVDRPAERPTIYGTITARRDLPRRPIVPAALRAGERGKTAAWMTRLGLHTAAYHGTRTPKYGVKVAAFAPIGLAMFLGRQLRWAWLVEQHGLRQDAANRNDAAEWMRLHVHARNVRAWRMTLLIAELVWSVVGVVTLWLFAPAWATWLVIIGLVLVFARVGRPEGKPITDRVTVGQVFIKLTAEMTRAGIVACGAGIKDPSAIKFVTDIGRDGPGFLAQVALPPGIVATDVIDKRDRLASGLRLPMDQVWPETVKGEHAGRLNLFVSDRPVSAMRQPSWPLLEDGTTDYFRPFPYGADIRLRPMTWSLAERNSLFGGIPGSGKSLAARNVLLGAVLDPLVLVAISELKGSGDYDCFEPLCPRGMYICGADDASIKASLRIIEWLHHECEVRPPIIAEYARQGLNDVKKLNRVMAERDDRLRPIVAMFDEYQELNSHSEVGKHASAMLLSAIKRGRSLGIHVIVATQRFDKDAMPKAISSLVTNRAALAVPAQPETDMILGTSAYRTGARPTAFVPGDDSGWMVRAGFAPGFETIRAAFINDQQAASVCARALAMRNGSAAPAVPRIHARNLLADVRQVWPHPETGWWLDDVLAALQLLDGDAYAEMDKATLSAALKAAGYAPQPVHRKVGGEGITRVGLQLAAMPDSADPAIDSAPDIKRSLRKRR
jgi:DNA segregation ATPase FtsK/SpoIIIE, S-DNA-T family